MVCLINILTGITNILYIPYVFTPVVILICILSCTVVIRYTSLKEEDIYYIIFAIIICVVLKTSTISIIYNYIDMSNQPAFIYSYFSLAFNTYNFPLSNLFFYKSGIFHRFLHLILFTRNASCKSPPS